jgi:two-component sensor histidine kinase/response regulator of citrate/malate metabolism
MFWPGKPAKGFPAGIDSRGYFCYIYKIFEEPDIAMPIADQSILAPAPPVRVLCIDDEPLIRMTVRDYLEDLGMAVQTAPDGQAGIDMVSAQDFDIVLLDLRMPRRDGLDVLGSLKELRPETPVIVISGTGRIQDVIEALHAGAWDFITKPIEDLAMLEYAMKKCLERARLLGENRRYREELETLVQERTAELTAANANLRQEIAERRAAEDALYSSLREKEVLLKEIHHRVKNNLQIVSSLLSLQAAKTSDHQLAGLLSESQNRVRTMALMHEKLYRSKDLAKVDFAGYLKDLTTFLLQSEHNQARNVDMRISGRDVSLSVDVAIPCALMVNELVSNSLKHAFAGRSQGQVDINLEVEDQDMDITVSDNGQGMPPGFDLEKTESLGLQLVLNLAHQLSGRVSLETGPGTAFHISFPLKA